MANATTPKAPTTTAIRFTSGLPFARDLNWSQG